MFRSPAAVFGPAFDDPAVGLFFLYPTESAWPDDREIVCVAMSLDGPATGSYADR